MAEISMVKRIQEQVRRAVREGTDLEKIVAGEWLDLWKRPQVLKETESSRFKELTFLWEKQCLNCWPEKGSQYDKNRCAATGCPV